MGAFISWIKTNMGGNEGEARDEEPQSVSGMYSTLVPVLIVSAVYLVIFLILRRSQRRFYAPRTYLGSLREHERSPELPGGWFNWIGTFWKIPDVHALKHQSLDAYLFLRYMRVCAIICFVSLCMTWPILFPINATGGNGQTQLEILSISNIRTSDNNKYRLFAHAIVAWMVYGFLMYMITRESIFYINLRQAFLLTPQSAKRLSSRTVLFTCVPDEYLDAARVRTIFPDSVKHVWIAGRTKEIDELVGDRDDAAMKLEKSEIKLLKTVNKKRAKAMKKNPDAPVARDTESGEISARWISNTERPTHRIGWKGLFGQKKDSIIWCREQLAKLIPQAEQAQAAYMAGDYEKVNAMFVEFHTQSDAQAAFQVVTHHHSLHMAPKYIGVTPNEVIWKNLSIPWWQLIIRRYAVYAFITALIVFWAIPVGIVGVISSVNTLKQLPGLTWISSIPGPILGVISGLLPAVALAILMSLVPVIMRLCAKLAGAASMSQVELFTQNSYFFFQLIQVFLIRTVTNTASTLIVQIVEDPGSVFTVLSEAIPTSSNFYISYFIVQGLSIAVSVLTQVVGCLIFNLLYRLFGSTPRALYTRWIGLSSISWGSVMPVYSTIVVISITYSVIAPIILFWSSLALALFYLAYRYNILFVSDTQIDTRGLIYPRALMQLFAGIYVAEICLIGMFAVSRSPGPAVLTAAFLVFTILYHMTLRKALHPLLYNLPRTLQMEEEAYQVSSANGTDGPLAGELTPEHTRSGNGNGNVNEKGKRLRAVVPGGGRGGAEKQGGLVSKFLKPWQFADYWTLRKLVPAEDSFNIPYQYDETVESQAYWPPSVTKPTPILWIPEDPLGVSKQEVEETSKVIDITDEGCRLDDKNKLVWDTEGARPPIWTEKVYY